MNFKQSLCYLQGLANYEKISDYRYGYAYNLDRIKRLARCLENPQEKYPTVTIAGTKGKGSTLCMLGSILYDAGIKTGMFSSPHLVSVRERIRVGRKQISRTEFASEISRIKYAAEKNSLTKITYFEALTAAAFLYFLRKKVDIAILEVGLGGRLDAVNIAESFIAAITPISYDHTQILGRSLEKIAKEKCGIIHSDSFIISAKQQNRALRVIRHTAFKKNARLLVEGQDFKVNNIQVSLSETRFDVETASNAYKQLHSPLAGAHQAHNAASAVLLAETVRAETGLKISKHNIRDGIGNALLPARFQILPAKPLIILDGAHNGASAEALRKTLLQVTHGKDITLILGLSSDKKARDIAENLMPIASRVIFTQSFSPRAMPAVDLARKTHDLLKDTYLCHTLAHAVIFARSMTPLHGIIVITGSLFLAGEALKVLGIKY